MTINDIRRIQGMKAVGCTKVPKLTKEQIRQKEWEDYQEATAQAMQARYRGLRAYMKLDPEPIITK